MDLIKWNKIKSGLFIALMALVLSHFFQSPPLPEGTELDLCDTDDHNFQAGEQIVYELYYNWGFIWIPAGEVEFLVKDKEDFIEITAIGSTYQSYDSFYKVRDTFYSLIDKKTMLPVRFYRDIEEGRYIMFSEINFDQNNHKATSSVSRKGNTRIHDFEFANCMHDLLSILYYFRNLDYDQFEENQHFPVNVLLDDKIYDITVRYLGKDKNKKVKGLGRYKSLKFSMDLIAGHIFNEGDQMKIWIGDDSNKIALLVESPISIGSVKAVLSDYSGLKHDFESKIK